MSLLNPFEGLKIVLKLKAAHPESIAYDNLNALNSENSLPFISTYKGDFFLVFILKKSSSGSNKSISNSGIYNDINNTLHLFPLVLLIYSYPANYCKTLIHQVFLCRLLRYKQILLELYLFLIL